MSKLTTHLLGMTVMLAGLWLAARLLLPFAQREGFDPQGGEGTLLGAALIGSPVLALLVFELVSGRALGDGFSIIRRAEASRAYWGWIAFHGLLPGIVLAASWMARRGGH